MPSCSRRRSQCIARAECSWTTKRGSPSARRRVSAAGSGVASKSRFAAVARRGGRPSDHRYPMCGVRLRRRWVSCTRRMDANPIVLDETAGDVVVVVVEGEHDIYTAPTLRERLEEALGRGGGIVVDLTARHLRGLVRARRAARRAPARDRGRARATSSASARAVEPGVQRILDITGLVPVLPVLQRPRGGDRGGALHQRRTANDRAAPPEVLLTMPARPEGVGVVRQALAGMADALDFDPSVLADMKMAVTEACTNVVVHAYDEDAGMLEVEMLADEDGPDDRGARPRRRHPAAPGALRAAGARPRPAADRRAVGRLRAASGCAGHGTEVRMTFAYARASDPAQANPVTGSVGADGRWDPDAATPSLAGGTRARAQPRLAGALQPRPSGGLAQRGELAHPAEPAERLGLDLAHPLGRDPELAADLAQRRRLAAVDPVAQRDDRALAVGQLLAARAAASPRAARRARRPRAPGPSDGSRSPNAASSPSPSGRSSDVTVRAASRSACRSSTRDLGLLGDLLVGRRAVELAAPARSRRARPCAACARG